MDITLIVTVVGLAASVYDEIRRNAAYKKAESYNAVAVIDDSGNVTEIKFLMRHP